MYFWRKTADYFRSNFSSIQTLILRFGYLWKGQTGGSTWRDDEDHLSTRTARNTAFIAISTGQSQLLGNEETIWKAAKPFKGSERWNKAWRLLRPEPLQFHRKSAKENARSERSDLGEGWPKGNSRTVKWGEEEGKRPSLSGENVLWAGRKVQSPSSESHPIGEIIINHIEWGKLTLELLRAKVDFR